MRSVICTVPTVVRTQTSIMMKKRQRNIKTGTLNLHGRFLEYSGIIIHIDYIYWTSVGMLKWVLISIKYQGIIFRF